MQTYVLYHGGCWDGFCAAWVARKLLGENAQYIPVTHGQPMPELEVDSVVYLLDFSYKRPQMVDLVKRMFQVVILDHHVSAKLELDGLANEVMSTGGVRPTVVFDMEKSGGRLAWDYFLGGDCPWLVDYTEDRDLWRWKLPHSREVNEWLRSLPLDFKIWDAVGEREPRSAEWLEAIAAGEAILRTTNQTVEIHTRRAWTATMFGFEVLVVNSTTCISEIAGALAKGRPFGVSYMDVDADTRVWSLRSDENGEDVSLLAASMGGGGHKRAAGFTTKIATNHLKIN